MGESPEGIVALVSTLIGGDNKAFGQKNTIVEIRVEEGSLYQPDAEEMVVLQDVYAFVVDKTSGREYVVMEITYVGSEDVVGYTIINDGSWRCKKGKRV